MFGSHLARCFSTVPALEEEQRKQVNLLVEKGVCLLCNRKVVSEDLRYHVLVSHSIGRIGID